MCDFLMKISLIRLKELLEYNPYTGIFTWKIARSNQILAGTIAGTTHLKGYSIIEVEGIQYKASILAWFYFYGQWPHKIVDHKDRDNSNDRITNLRLASKEENTANTKLYRNNKSGFRGVSYAPGGKWKAYIRINGRPKHLGVFDTPEEASEAYTTAAKEIYGDFVGELN